MTDLSLRQGSAIRTTHETKISAKVTLEGSGNYQIDTGIGFFDHMLSQLSRHSLVDIALQAQGDLHIDYHHTVEDCGYVLGRALNEALGPKLAINRFGHAYAPMDETLTRVVIDLSGRPYLIYDCQFHSEKIGQFDTELLKEFYQALALSLGANIHVTTLYGANAHHIAESGFKALAKALKMAIALDPAAALTPPSTKGSLQGAD